MSKAATSPTARLLQTSRLFSLPRPLPPPPLEGLSSTGLFRGSDTATTPYPTHQAITTPRSSLSRGDFGLKRALPAKTTRNTSTPHVRVKAQDTWEHVTEFASAADHTQTREKWLEMGVPIVETRQSRKDGGAGEKIAASVFEAHRDNTDPEMPSQVDIKPPRRQMRIGASEESVKLNERWKYAGPSIASMQEGEFQTWLQTTMRRRKGEWREYLRRKRMEERLGTARTNARREGISLSAAQLQELARTATPTDEELEQYEKKLRDDHLMDGLSSRLSQLLTDFLDLPPLGSNVPQAYPALTTGLQTMMANYLGDKGPPSTHPAAGLGHLRTNAIMENHPLWGPQKNRAPVQARVVRARNQTSGFNEQSARLGVGGFVAADPITPTATPATFHTMPEADRMALQLNPDLVGGNKMWVHPGNATVDEKGRIVLSVSRADNEALAVKKGDVESIHEAKRAGLPGMKTGNWDANSVARTAPASPSVTPRPRVRPFDVPAGDGAQGSEQAAADQMRGLLEQHTRPKR